MTRRLPLATATLAAALLAAGNAFAQQTAPSAEQVTLKTAQSDKYGTYLTDAQGRALYMFEIDKQGQGKTEAVSNCYDACAKAWPPLIAKGTPQAGPQVDKSLIATIERKGGARQVTYNGWPLYYFIKDTGPGMTTGQDVKGFGGEWYLLSAKGQVVHAAEGKGAKAAMGAKEPGAAKEAKAAK